MAEKVSSEEESKYDPLRRLIGNLKEQDLSEEETYVTVEYRKSIKELDLSDEYLEELIEKNRRMREANDKLYYGPYAYELYRRVLEDGEEEDSSIRVNVVGNFGQGKTSLVARLLGKDIKGLESTNGIEISRYKCQQDASGHISYEENPKLDSSVIAKRLATAAEKTAGLTKKGNRLRHMLGTKQPKHMSEEEQNTLIKLIKEEGNETSTSDSSKVPACRLLDIWDFGGQYVFYATHTLFHSRKAVYLLVFNLTCGLKDTVRNDEEECCVDMEERTMEYYIKFWVNSIHSFVGSKDGTEPKIILIGTHMDQLEGNVKSKQKQAKVYFDAIKAELGKQRRRHIFREISLDNRTSEENVFNSLRDDIFSAGQGYVLSTRKPAKWIKLEQLLFDRRHEEIVEFETVVQIDSENEYPLRETEQLKLFLQHQHDQGTLFYFDEEPISQYVVLNPQFLVNAFKCIITADRFARDMEEVDEFWQKLKTEARLEIGLVDIVWGSAANKKFIIHKKTILWFLQKHRIISEAMMFDEEKKEASGLGWYVVPSLLKDHSQAKDVGQFVKGRKQTKIKFAISFDESSIVPTVYYRLIAAVLGRWPIATYKGKRLLYDNVSIVRIDVEHAGTVEMMEKHILLHVLNLCPSRNVNRLIPDAFRRFAESVVLFEFRKFRRNQDDLPYTRGYTCNHESHYEPCTVVEAYTQLDGKDVLPCPELEPHEIETAVAKAEWFQDKEPIEYISSERMTAKTVSKLSQYVGGNWEILGAALGIKPVKMDQIKADYPSNTCLQFYYSLLHWIDAFPDKASLHTLVKELRDLPKVAVDWDGIRNIVEEGNASQHSSETQ